MPKKIDITEDTDELEDDESEQDDDEEELEGEEDDDEEEDQDDEEEDEEEESPKKQNAALRKELAQLRALISSTKEPGNKGEGGKKSSRVEAAFAKLISGGVKPSDLTVLYSLFTELKADLKDEAEESRKSTTAADLGDRCMEVLEDEFARAAKNNKQLQWARKEIVDRAISLMQRSVSFEDARQQWDSGRVPSRQHFSRAVARVIQTYQKETGTKSSSKSEGLDIGSSKLKGKPTKTTRDGEIDVDKLSDFDRNVYLETLNVTGNKKLALEALRDIRAGLKGLKK